MKAVAIVAASLALLLATGKITFSVTSGAAAESPAGESQDAARLETVRAAATPTARDVLGLMYAAAPKQNDLDNAQLATLVDHVLSSPDRATLRMFARQFPPLARRVDRLSRRLSKRVADWPVETKVGETCRAPTLRLLARKRMAIASFARTIRRRGTTTHAGVALFSGRLHAAELSWERALDACLAAATTADRAAIDAAFEE